MILAFLGLVVGGWVIYELIKWVQDSLRPGPWGFPILGRLPQALMNMDKLYDMSVETAQRYPRGFFFRIFHDRINFLLEPDDVEHILQTKWKNYIQGPLRNAVFEDFLGKGIFNIDGALWFEQRKTSSKLFSVVQFRDFVDSVFTKHGLQVVDRLARAADEGTAVDVPDLVARYTLDSIGTIAFGVELGNLANEEPSRFTKAFDFANREVYRRFTDPLWRFKRFFNLGVEKELHSALEYMDQYAYEVINRRKQLSSEERQQRPDLLTRFMELQALDPLPDKPTENDLYLHSDRYLKDIVLNISLAGRDTTANGLSWCFWLLAQHPDVEQRIIDELDAANINASFASIDYDVINELTYLKAVVAETLRLYPSVPEDGKYVVQDDVLPSGMKVYAGEWASYAPYTMARLPSIWGPDAPEFKPSRWIDEQGRFIRHSSYKYPVFQAGPRQCLGIDLARIEMCALLALVLPRFRLRLVPNQRITYDVALTLPMKYGMKMTVERR